MERDVWNRVFSPGQPGMDPALPELLRQMEALEGLYRKWGQEALRKRQQDCCALLRGTAVLLGHRIRQETGTVNLRAEQAWHRSRKLMEEFAARCAVPEVGLLFQALARQMEEQCLELARLLGRAGNK